MFRVPAAPASVGAGGYQHAPHLPEAGRGRGHAPAVLPWAGRGGIRGRLLPHQPNYQAPIPPVAGRGNVAAAGRVGGQQPGYGSPQKNTRARKKLMV